METRISDDLSIIKDMLDNKCDEDYPYLLDWAIEHDDGLSEEIMPVVVQCYQVCAARGMPSALLNLGALYYTGRFVPQSYQMAESLYQEAAEKGQHQAWCNLGYIYYYGRVGEADYEKAFECFLKGILLSGDGNCFYKLGDMYRRGLHVKKDPALAFQLYIRAAGGEQNYQQEYLSDVYLRLGECLLTGEGVEKDLQGAIHFLNAAREGYLKRNDGDPFGNVKKNIRHLTHLLSRLFQELDAASAVKGD